MELIFKVKAKELSLEYKKLVDTFKTRKIIGIKYLAFFILKVANRVVIQCAIRPPWELFQKFRGS